MKERQRPRIRIYTCELGKTALCSEEIRRDIPQKSRSTTPAVINQNALVLLMSQMERTMEESMPDITLGWRNTFLADAIIPSQR
jgi:hypothetical protein